MRNHWHTLDLFDKLSKLFAPPPRWLRSVSRDFHLAHIHSNELHKLEAHWCSAAPAGSLCLPACLLVRLFELDVSQFRLREVKGQQQLISHKGRSQLLLTHSDHQVIFHSFYGFSVSNIGFFLDFSWLTFSFFLLFVFLKKLTLIFFCGLLHSKSIWYILDHIQSVSSSDWRLMTSRSGRSRPLNYLKAAGVLTERPPSNQSSVVGSRAATPQQQMFSVTVATANHTSQENCLNLNHLKRETSQTWGLPNTTTINSWFLTSSFTAPRWTWWLNMSKYYPADCSFFCATSKKVSSLTFR